MPPRKRLGVWSAKHTAQTRERAVDLGCSRGAGTLAQHVLHTVTSQCWDPGPGQQKPCSSGMRPLSRFCRTPQNRSPKKMLTRELLSTPAQLSPARPGPLTCPLPATASSPPTARAGQSSRGQVQACPVPLRPYALPRPQLRMCRQGPRAPPRPEEAQGPVMRRREKRGCAAVLQGARSQPPPSRPGPRPLLPAPVHRAQSSPPRRWVLDGTEATTPVARARPSAVHEPSPAARGAGRGR